MSMMGQSGYGMMRSMRKREELGGKRVNRATAARVLRFARPYRRIILVFLAVVVVSSVIAVVTPLLAGDVINAITGGKPDAGSVVIRLAVAIAVLSILDAALLAGPAGAVVAHRRGHHLQPA